MKIEINDIPMFKAALTASAQHDSRFYLNGCLFEKGGFVVGCDGHRLVKTKCCEYEGDDIIISIKRTVPARTALIIIDTDINIVQYMRGKEEIKIDRCKVIDGKYPDYRRLKNDLPKEEPGNDFAFNPLLVSDIQKAMGGSAKWGLNFHFTDKKSAILFAPGHYGFNDERFLGMLMPVRL